MKAAAKQATCSEERLSSAEGTVVASEIRGGVCNTGAGS